MENQSEYHEMAAQLLSDEDTKLVASVFGNKYLVFRIMNLRPELKSLELFLEYRKPKVMELLERYAIIHDCINFQMNVVATYEKPMGPSTENVPISDFAEKKSTICHCFKTLYLAQAQDKETLEKKVDEVNQELIDFNTDLSILDSKWSLTGILYIDLHINKDEPFSEYIGYKDSDDSETLLLRDDEDL